MSKNDNIGMEDWAAAVIDSNGTVKKQRGCALQPYTPGSGVYEFALDKALNTSECTATVLIRDYIPTGDTEAYLQNVSDTVKQIQIMKSSVGAEANFTVVFRKIL